MNTQHLLLTLGGSAAALTAVSITTHRLLGGVRRMFKVADVILGTDEHKALAERLDAIEHELTTNNGSSLRDVNDRVEQLARQLRAEQRRNAKENRQRREQDQELLERIGARVDAIWQAQSR